MDSVKAHYDSLLGSVYSWILGDFDTAAKKNAALFEALDISPVGDGYAVDLGAGPGCQALPLAARGFRVLAIDFCADLVEELRSRAGDAAVEARLGDIRAFRDHLTGAPELIVCMGDTLVHLPDHDDAHTVLADAAAALAPGGTIVVSIRDYDAPGPRGPDRFIPIRSSDEQIFTCFLEYGDRHVDVHDILQQKRDGKWLQSISQYRKIRLSMNDVAASLESAGLDSIARCEDSGMLVLTGRKPEG